MMWKVLLAFLVTLATTSSTPPCADITHSECGDDDAHLFLETTAPDKDTCQGMCLFLGETCHFSLFDNEAFARGNCRLYDENFSRYILHCNELAGPKTSEEGCDLLYPPDNTCQIYRSGKCDFEEVQEKHSMNSWENCQAICKSTSECQFWRFEKEEKLCLILYSAEKTCTWEFSPREPLFKDCGNSCEIPAAQQFGDWFCPPSPSTNTATCHLECHPGYISDKRTVISCTDGLWSGSPVCVEAIGLITGGGYDNTLYTVEVYGEEKHQILPNLPDMRFLHTLDTTDGYILLCGGATTKTSCLELTPSLDWRSHSTTTKSRNHHSSVSILGQLHLLGGEKISTTEHLSPATSITWIAGHDLLEETSSACAAKIHPEVFIVTGGYYNPGHTSVISYNVTSGAATRLQNMNQGRHQHGCLYIRQSPNFRGILVAGGRKPETGNPLSQSELLDLSTGHWTITTGTLTRPREGFPIVQLGNKILAFGGIVDNTPSAIVDLFNITSMEWTAGEEMLEPRWHHAVTGVPSNLVGIAIN